jgi:hypothetical protein
LDAVEDVDPARLRATAERRLEDASMAPGVLTLLSARAVAEGPSPPLNPGDEGPDPIARRAAGVQLIYEGLRLTRSLAQDEPWVTGDDGGADLAILAADVMVARGFYLLARTEAADAAVATVRNFGRDQTLRRETGDASLDQSLEADVLDLATVTGTPGGGGPVSGPIREYAAGLAGEALLPPAEDLLAGDVVERLATLAAETGPTDGVRTSADH